MAVRLLVLLLGTLIFAGCYFYTAQIQMDASNGTATGEDVQNALALLRQALARHGFAEHPRSAEIRRGSESPESAYRVLDVYSLAEDGATWHRVAVYAEVHRQTGRFRVLIRDLDSRRQTQFTATVEQNVTDELKKAFPGRQIKVKRETVGPAFGP